MATSEAAASFLHSAHSLIANNWQHLLGWVVFFQVLQWLSRPLLRRYFGDAHFASMTPTCQSQLEGRLVATIHALIALAEIPGSFNMPESCKDNPHYCYVEGR